MIKKVVNYTRYTKQQLVDLNQKVDELGKKIELQERINKELLFANYFQDSIKNSTWVKDKSFSAFGGAANYSMLYKLFKVLDIIKPNIILEFGLGQTTKLTCQYAEANKNKKVIVIDDDTDWVDMYKKQTKVPKNLELITLELQDFRYKNKVLQRMGEYKDLDKVLGKTQFNLVIVDGPIGYDKEYPRTNVISLVNNLAKDFVVIFDDAEREGEQRTLDLFRKELNKSSIEFAEFSWNGSKTQHYFCAKHLYKMTFAI